MGVVIKKYRGDTLQLPISLQDDGGLPIDISGASVRFSLGGLIKETSQGVTVSVNGAQGSILITVPYTLMETLTENSYRIDVEITYSSGVRETLFVGSLILEDDVST